MKRWLFLIHRWLGIPLCAVMALWFLSGMVMLYVGYPKLTTDERHQGLAPLQADGCCVPLAQALQAAGLAEAAPAPASSRCTWATWPRWWPSRSPAPMPPARSSRWPARACIR